MAYKSYQARHRFANLDGLRCLCILMVIWHHAPAVNNPSLPILTRGFLGVDFFFVLSGYLITTLLLREAAANNGFSLRNFYIRRILRIIPVYFFVVTLMAAYVIGIKGEIGYLEILPYYYLFLSNFLTDHIPTLDITWSLSVEEQFYLIWPLLMLILPQRILPWAALALIVMNILIATGLWPLAPYSLGPLLLQLPNATYDPMRIGA